MGSGSFDDINAEDLTWDQILALQAYQDSSFRLIVFMFSISIAVLTFAKENHKYVVVGICSILILLTLIYAVFMVTQVNRVLTQLPNYSALNPVFYYTSIILFFFIYIFMMLNIDWTGFKARSYVLPDVTPQL